jgi:hypothetical protein
MRKFLRPLVQTSKVPPAQAGLVVCNERASLFILYGWLTLPSVVLLRGVNLGSGDVSVPALARHGPRPANYQAGGGGAQTRR